MGQTARLSTCLIAGYEHLPAHPSLVVQRGWLLKLNQEPSQ